MRKSTLLLLSIFLGCLGFICHAAEGDCVDEYIQVPPYIDESSVVFDYTPDPGYQFIGTLSFKAILPPGTSKIIVRFSDFHDHFRTYGHTLGYFRSVMYTIDGDTNEWVFSRDKITWGTYITFQIITEDGIRVSSSNVIYTDDYMKPEDVAVFKPTSGGE